MSKPQNGEPAADDPEVMFQMPGPTVSFSRLHYSVMESNGLCHKTGPEKHILKDISGIMRPGMNAIMGPTGSGKTSLLDVIAGRKDPAGLKFGQVLIDGKMVDSDLRLISAYVVQPRYSIFSRFDHLTLMHRGELVYAGAAGKALSYFTDLGYHCEPFNNPSDFFLDVTNGEAQSTLDITSFNYDDKENCDNSNLLNVSYRQSTQYQRVVEELDHLTQGLEGGVGGQGQKADYVTSFWYQMRIVGGRMVVNSLRNPQTSYAQLALNIFFALLVGLIYYQIPLTLPEALQNRMGAFFFLIINMVFGNLSAVELFINERALFIHENSSGYYRTSVYFLSKIFADLIPNRIVPIIIFSAIAYYMMGLKPAFTAFLLFTLTMSLVSLAAVSLAFLVSASVSSFAMANVLIALPFVFMMVFGGFLVNLNSMLSWLSWLKWISIFRYGLEAVTINEFKGQIFYSNTTIIPGEVYLETQGIDYSTWGFWQNHVALSGIITVCMVLAYIQLRRINRWK
uniref:broad substrate specificity ATP-binding cassette transporter ABCG2-like isoform X5 n=1 Tax=Oncorhynchus gorbuscha TaxID=8017 RepID=UPI001EAF030D|nr:broad substrate specificity ATP-binding cassette transporter ABCG2-like isoform X5 [Oncorhynchus gorbuscha]